MGEQRLQKIVMHKLLKPIRQFKTMLQLKERLEAQKIAIEKLVETRSRLSAEVVQLRNELTEYKKRHYGEDIDPAAHNTTESMDKFFGDIKSLEPYLKFAHALKTILKAHGIDLHARSLLDWGTGPGIVLHDLVRHNAPARIVGYDTSEVALTNARRLMPDGVFMIGDIYRPVCDQYDVVLCTEVLEHLESPATALRNLLGARAPSGAVVVTVPDGRIDYSRYHINFWSPESWKLFIEAHLPPSVTAMFGTFHLSDGTAHRNNYAVIRSA